MKRMDYETLAMEEIVVEMENGFLVASVNVENTGENSIENQSFNTDFGSDFADDNVKKESGYWEI